MHPQTFHGVHPVKNHGTPTRGKSGVGTVENHGRKEVDNYFALLVINTLKTKRYQYGKKIESSL